MILRESPETQKGIETLARRILANYASNALGYLRDKIKPGQTINLYLDYEDCGAVTLGSVFKGITKRALAKWFPETICDFILGEPWLRIVAEHSAFKQPNYLGSYGPDIGQNTIKLYFRMDFPLTDSKTMSALALPFFMRKYDTLVHEITHAYDDWISQGKYTHNKRSKLSHSLRSQTLKSSSEADEKTAYKAYLNDPIEINARFQQFVAMYRNTLSRQKWREAVDHLRWEMPGFKEISRDEQIRLLKRLSVIWAAMQPQHPKDATEATEAYRERISARYGVDVRLRYSYNANLVEIDSFGTQDAALRKQILDDVRHYGDIWQTGVALDPSLAVDQVTKAEAKRLGFRINSGGKRNFASSAQFISDPKKRLTKKP